MRCDIIQKTSFIIWECKAKTNIFNDQFFFNIFYFSLKIIGLACTFLRKNN